MGSDAEELAAHEMCETECEKNAERNTGKRHLYP
jgi:hypothetical protein